MVRLGKWHDQHKPSPKDPDRHAGGTSRAWGGKPKREGQLNLVAAVIDGGSATTGSDILIFGERAFGRVATRPAAIAPLSLRWQRQALQLGQVDTGQPDGSFEIFTVLFGGS